MPREPAGWKPSLPPGPHIPFCREATLNGLALNARRRRAGVPACRFERLPAARWCSISSSSQKLGAGCPRNRQAGSPPYLPGPSSSPLRNRPPAAKFLTVRNLITPTARRSYNCVSVNSLQCLQALHGSAPASLSDRSEDPSGGPAIELNIGTPGVGRPLPAGNERGGVGRGEIQ